MTTARYALMLGSASVVLQAWRLAVAILDRRDRVRALPKRKEVKDGWIVRD